MKKSLVGLFLGLLVATGIWAATDKRESAHIFCFIEQLTNGTDYSCFHAQDSFTGSVDFTLPDGDGNSGQAITTDGAGALSWSDAAGGGGTGVNFIVDSNDSDSSTGENTVGSWVSFDDGASAVPVDGTGGSAAAVTCQRTTTASEILNGVASIELAKSAADGQGEGCAIDFNIPIGYRNSRLAIQALLMTDDTNYDTGDAGIWLYNVDSAALVPLEKRDTSDDLGRELPFGISGNGDANIYHFTPTNDTDDEYRLIFHVITTDANAWDVGWDDISVGPAPIASGAIVGDWTAWTPTNTQGFGTITSVNLEYRRVGSTMEIRGDFTTGTVAASEAQLELPDSLTVENSSILHQFSGRIIQDASVGNSTLYVITDDGDTFLNFSYTLEGGSRDPTTPQNGTTLFGSTERLTLWAIVPIAEWSGSGNFGDPNEEYACSDTGTFDAAAAAGDTTRGGRNFAGCDTDAGLTTTRDKVVEFLSLESGDHIELQFHSSSSDDFLPHPSIGGRNWDYSTESPCSSTATDTCGFGIHTVDYDANTVQVRFGRYGFVDDTTQTTWPDEYYWRVKVTHAAPIAAELASENNAGLVAGLNRWQQKFLASDTGGGGNGTMSDLTYTLEAGKTYRITVNATFTVEEDDAVARVDIMDGANTVSRIEVGETDSATASDTVNQSGFVSVIYTMVGTSLTFDAAALGSGSQIRGNGTAEETWALVGELKNYSETSDW